MIKLNFKHLSEYATASSKADNFFLSYVYHLIFSVRQALLLLVMGIVSIVHGIFPFLFDFWLMEKFIDIFVSLKKNFPNYGRLKNITINKE
jgi:hypothetical protein